MGGGGVGIIRLERDLLHGLTDAFASIVGSGWMIQTGCADLLSLYSAWPYSASLDMRRE